MRLGQFVRPLIAADLHAEGREADLIANRVGHDREDRRDHDAHGFEEFHQRRHDRPESRGIVLLRRPRRRFVDVPIGGGDDRPDGLERTRRCVRIERLHGEPRPLPMSRAEAFFERRLGGLLRDALREGEDAIEQITERIAEIRRISRNDVFDAEVPVLTEGDNGSHQAIPQRVHPEPRR